jgi:L-fuconolactonase
MTDSPDNRPPPRIDAHTHVWDTTRRLLPWLPADHPLRRDFTLADLAEASGGRLPDTFLVQADADPREVTDLLALAATTPSILGVVGWLNLHDNLTHQLTTLTHHAKERSDLGSHPAKAKERSDLGSHPAKAKERSDLGPRPTDLGPRPAKLLGIRCPPADQTDPDALTDPALVRGVQSAADAGLAIDLLLRPSALIGAARLATAVPNARLVLDHLGNPAEMTSDWSIGMKALADCPNVTVKLSGTAHLPPDLLAELIAVTLDLFGSDRLMFGSDWPVCTLSSSRAEVIRRTTELLPAAAHNDVFRGTAERTYRP